MGFTIDLDPNMPLIVTASVIGVMAILLIGFVNVRYIFYMWVVTLPFSQWSIYDLGSMNLYVDRVILLLLLLMSLFYFLIRKMSFSKISVVELFMLGFTLVCIISAIKSNSLDREGFGSLLAAYIYPFIGYYLARSIMQNEKDVRNFSFIIIYLGIYLAYIGICEQLYPDIVFPRYIVNPTYIISNVGRSVGPSLEPVGYGMGLLFCLLVTIYYFYKANSLLNPTKILAYIAFLITPIAIFFTYTRAVWIGLIISLFILFLFYPRGKKVIGSLLAILILIFVLIQTIQISKIEGSAKDVVERDSIYVRLSMVKTGMKMFMNKPVFGVGYSQARKEFPRYFQTVGTSEVPGEGFLMHNTFVNILVEFGLVGFIPFLLILIYLIKDAINLYKKSFDNRDIAIIFLAACAAFIFAAMANNMHYKFAHVLLFCMAGMVKGRLDAKLLSRQESNVQETFRSNKRVKLAV